MFGIIIGLIIGFFIGNIFMGVWIVNLERKEDRMLKDIIEKKN